MISLKLVHLRKGKNKMNNDKKDTAIRKRQLIAKANRTVFITVAIASAIVGIATVLGTFLVREMMFNAKVIGEQDKSIATLKSNITNVKDLESKMETLQTNSALLSSRASTEDNALRVILDALPASENTAALGASLSNKLLNVPGVEIDSISVNTASADSTTSAGTTTDSATSSSSQSNTASPQPIEFSFSVTSSSPSNILTVIQNLEKSIRTVNIKTFRIEQNKENMTLTVTADAYYLTQADINLRTQTIKSTEGSTSSSTTSTTTDTSTTSTTEGQ